MHEQALLDHLSNYHKQPMSINIRISLATSNPGDTIDHAIPQEKRRTENGIDRGRIVPTMVSASLRFLWFANSLEGRDHQVIG